MLPTIVRPQSGVGWIPPVSPVPLLQEYFWPDAWKITVVCIMLNCTQRKQVEPIICSFFNRWPDARSLLDASDEDVANHVRTLGFYNRRTKTLKRFSREFLEKNWTHINELHGVGDYASRAWEIFCQGTMGPQPPKDHALTYYWQWANSLPTYVSECTAERIR